MKSPFKFLDSYQKEDNDVFFGRKHETEALYQALSGVKHLLVYGASGAGKTSLIECGLRNQFSDADWFALTIRREENMIASIYKSINNVLEFPFEIDITSGLPKDKEIDFGKAIEYLFEERFQPIYLLFDQFEELLLFGNHEEKKDFFTRINKLISQRIPCRLLMIMREEFIGHLTAFEEECPSIFQNRFRLEKMTRKQVMKVIEGTVNAPKFNKSFTVIDATVLSEKILDRLPDEQQEIELAHVQVFLDQLWEKAYLQNQDSPLLAPKLISKQDKLETVLDRFLEKQLTEIDYKFGKEMGLELLAVMISEKYTKLQISFLEINNQLLLRQVDTQNQTKSIIDELEQRRIIRALKSGTDTRYEISHDVLALLVGKNLTEEMKRRDKAREVYIFYLERTGRLSIEDIQHIKKQEEFLPLPKLLKSRLITAEKAIREEEEAIKKKELYDLEKEKRQQRKIIIVVTIALIVSLAFGIWGYSNLQMVKEERDLTEKLTVTGNLRDAQNYVNDEEYQIALQKYLYLRDTILQGQTTTNIEESLLECKRLNSLSKTYYKLLNEADSLLDITDSTDNDIPLIKTKTILNEAERLKYMKGIAVEKLNNSKTRYDLILKRKIENYESLAAQMNRAGLKRDANVFIEKIKLLKAKS